MTQPVGINVTSTYYAHPCVYIDQAWAGARGRGSASSSTIRVPLEMQEHEYTLVTDPSVKSLKVAGVATPITNGRAVFKAKGTPGHGTTITLVTPLDPPVSIVRTEWLAMRDAGEIFSPAFVACMVGTPSVRFMDMARANDTQITAWTSKDLPTFDSIPMPVEHMAALCNKLNANMYFNLPPTVPMDEAHRVVALGKSLLNPTLKFRTSWANEVWNTQFAIAKTAKASGDAPGFYGRALATYEAALRGIDGVEIVAEWMHMSPVASKQKVVDAYKAAGGKSLTGFATALYAWNETATVGSFLASKDVAGLVASLEANRAARAAKTAETANWARSQGLTPMFYETGLGPSTYGTDQAQFAALATQTVDAGAIFGRMMDDADAAGIGERHAYTSAASGVFGFWPDYDVDPYPIGKVWQARNRPTNTFAAEIAAIRAQLDDLSARIDRSVK